MLNFINTLKEIGIHQRFAIDILSVKTNLRKFGLIHIPINLEKLLTLNLKKIGLIVFEKRFLTHQNDPHSREGILIDCVKDKTPNFVELWYALDTTSPLPNSTELFSNPGRNLGYPLCCISKWEKLQSQRDLYKIYLLEKTSGYWELNRLATFFQEGLLIPDFYPCSMHCQKAREFVLPMHELSKKIFDDTWFDKTAKWMKAPILIHNEHLYIFPVWKLKDANLELMLAESAKISINDIGTLDLNLKLSFNLIPFNHLSSVKNGFLLKNNTEIIPIQLFENIKR